MPGTCVSLQNAQMQRKSAVFPLPRSSCRSRLAAVAAAVAAPTGPTAARGRRAGTGGTGATGAPSAGATAGQAPAKSEASWLACAPCLEAAARAMGGNTTETDAWDGPPVPPAWRRSDRCGGRGGSQQHLQQQRSARP